MTTESGARSRRAEERREGDRALFAHRIDVTLAAILVGFRVVGAGWLTLLAGIALASSDRPDVAIAWSAILLSWFWALLTVAVVRRRPEHLLAWPWLVLDLAVALWTLAAPLIDGSASAINYAGGFPIASVMLWAYARGFAGGFAAGAAASAVVISSTDYSASGKISTTVLYMATGLLVAWGAGVLRRNEAIRLALEEDLAAERAQRERSEERAELSARIHDSVLQTLALIQRRADDPQEVQTLARQQEHDLRSWLFAPSGGDLGDSLATAVTAVGREVEDRYRVKVDVVTVGDCELDDRLGALVHASREALVNAAKFSGVSDISVYVEVDPTQTAVYVRDRGAGFDVDGVDGNRRGITDSIVGRMERHGGSAVIRSEPGRGTEVELAMSRE